MMTSERSVGVLSVCICSGLSLVWVRLPAAAGEREALGAPVVVQPEMGAPLHGLTTEQLARFQVGRTAFDKEFSESEGRGPIFNQTSCGNCHNNPLGGSGTITVTRFGMASKGGFDPLTQLGGSLLQAEQISDECGEDIPPEANVIALRLTNSTLGFGLVEAIPDADILAYADPDDANSDGISGKATMVTVFEDPGVLHVGRFGWKSQNATVLTFSAGASLNEIGITNRFVMADNDPNGINPPELADCDTVADPEDGPDEEGFDFIDRVTDFQRFLANPPQTPRSGMTGEALFYSIGCADCHIASYSTPDDPALEDAIRSKVLHPYSDFLLHDMGQGADFIAQGMASEFELRTPPLWGLRKRNPMWHDGRAACEGIPEEQLATCITRVMRWHCAANSEAQSSAQRFLSGVDFTGEDPPCTDLNLNPCPCASNGVVPGGLDDAQRAQVIAFLDSLGKREFDSDGNSLVDLNDYQNFLSCSQVAGPITPDDPCAVHDVNQDGVLDETDLNAFISKVGSENDCNCNGQADGLDILTGSSVDANGDGVPDECESGDTPLCQLVLPLDIKPGKCPNSVKRDANGAVWMVLLGTGDFDITQIDGATLQLMRADGVGGAVLPQGSPRLKDEAAPFSGEPCGCHSLGPDGLMDLRMKFHTLDIENVLELDAMPTGVMVELKLAGTTLKGEPVVGYDCIRIDR